MQVTSGMQFIEIMESIKKFSKNLKQTNFGKKIYDNLMTNYGDYLNTSVSCKPTKIITQKSLPNPSAKKPALKKDKNN